MTAQEAKEKIRKLLALASDGACDNEAQNALLAARRLMAQYKIAETDIEEKERVSYACYDDLTFSGIRNAWFPRLAKVIAEHHCCGMCAEGYKGSEVKNIKFVGLGDDPNIAVLIFSYAVEHILHKQEEINESYKLHPGRKKIVKQFTFNYALGFADGLKEKYDEQDRQHDPGMSLMVVTPAEVDSFIGNLPTIKLKTETIYANKDARNLGFDHGYHFNPNKRLKTSEA